MGSLAIRTAEHIGADRNRVIESSVNRVQETADLRSRATSLPPVSRPSETSHQRAYQNTLRQWRERSRANNDRMRRGMQQFRSGSAPISRRDSGFYDDIMDGVRRRQEIVSQIRKNLEDPDMKLSDETRVQLHGELREHRHATEQDLIVLRQRTERSRDQSSTPWRASGASPRYRAGSHRTQTENGETS